jgi:hypothetical protein
MEEDSLVRSVVQKNAARIAERRLEKRQAAQSRRRVRLTDAATATRGAEDISVKEVQTLVNLCKGGKISTPELKILSQVGRKALVVFTDQSVFMILFRIWGFPFHNINKNQRK